MRLAKFIFLFALFGANMVFGNTQCIVEKPTKIEVSLDQISITNEGIFVELAGELLPVQAIIATEKGYKIVPKTGEQMIKCSNCGSFNPNWFLRCAVCREPL